jgi:NTE family protein
MTFQRKGSSTAPLRAWVFLAFPSLLFLGIRPAAAQEAARPSRPRIVLALGGGAARGFAHIGVLEWLEEHRIPVDAVVGTSMGGLVGGAYATGMSTREIRALVDGVPWDEVFRSETPYALKTFRRKEDERAYPAHLVLGLRGGVQLPSGLSPGQPVALLLDRVAQPYGTLASFDDLPIPFRCVATDMTRAETVILKEGSLATALRATMSLPGLFPPVERDGRLLADGGMLDNVPADAARRMGADVVIAVDVGAALADATALGTLSDVLKQSVAVMMAANTRRALTFADLVLVPDLDGISSSDYKKSDLCADRGYQAAAAKARFLQSLSVDEATWQAYRAQRESRRRVSVGVPEFIQVEGVGPREEAVIRERLQGYIGQPLDTARLETDLTVLTGSGRYETMTYQVVREGERNGLRITATERPSGPAFMRFAVGINGAQPEAIDFNLGTRITALDVGTPGSEWRTDLAVGTHLGGATEYYHPFGGRLFLAPRLFTVGETQHLYQHGVKVAEYRLRNNGAGLDLGRAISRNSELRLGYEISHLNAEVHVGSPLLPKAAGGVSAVRLRYGYEGVDAPIVPTRGVRVSSAFRWVFQAPGARSSFPLAELQLSAFKPIGKHGIGFVAGNGGTALGHDAPPVLQFTLGGPLTLGAYGQDEFRGSNYILGRLGYLHRIGQLPSYLGGKSYAVLLVESGSAFERLNAADFHGDVTGGFYLDTLLGPAFFGGSWGGSGRSKLFFSFGQLF